jgi:hypothetical protein
VEMVLLQIFEVKQAVIYLLLILCVLTLTKPGKR